MIGQALELHDSELAVLWYGQHEEAILIFSYLYIHKSLGEPGAELGDGWYERAELLIENASLTEHIRAWPCDIITGEIELDGSVFMNCAPVPFSCKKAFRILLEAVDNDGNCRKIEVKGSAARLRLLGKIGAGVEGTESV